MPHATSAKKARTIRTQAQLIDAAKAAGLKVTFDGSGHTTIERSRNRRIVIWADKVIHDLNVDYNVAARLNITDAIKLLQLDRHSG